MTRILLINFCKRSLSRSGKPRLGENAEGEFCLKNSINSSISGPDRYMIPVAMSMLTYIRFLEGRMDWKYPLHSSMPPPIFLLPSGVKKERVLNGNFWLGPIRMTTFKAFNVTIQVNERSSFKTTRKAYHDRSEDSVVLRLLPGDETMQ